VATGVIVMAIVSGGPEIGKFMDLLLTTRSVRRLAASGGFIYFVVFLAKPVHKRKTLSSSSLNTRPQPAALAATRMSA